MAILFTYRSKFALTVARWLLLVSLCVSILPRAVAQTQAVHDPPTSYMPADQTVPTPPPPELSTSEKALQAVSWYLPNRVMDILDIPRAYLEVGDGQGISLRATKWMQLTWFENDSECLGLTKRTPPLFGESISERYFGFLFAQQGHTQRDPTEIGISAHVLSFGFNFALSAGEALDALTGFVGIDLMGDDHGPVFYDAVPPASKPAAVAPAAADQPTTASQPAAPEVPDENSSK